MNDDMSFDQMRRDVLPRLQWLCKVPPSISDSPMAGQRALTYLESLCESMQTLENKLKDEQARLDRDRDEFEVLRSQELSRIAQVSQDLQAKQASLQQQAELDDLSMRMNQMDLAMRQQNDTIMKQQTMLQTQQDVVQEGQTNVAQQLRDQSMQFFNLRRACDRTKKHEAKVSHLQAVIVQQSDQIETLQDSLTKEEKLRMEASDKLKHARHELERVIRIAQTDDPFDCRPIQSYPVSGAATPARGEPAFWRDEIQQLTSRLLFFKPRIEYLSRSSSTEILDRLRAACDTDAIYSRLRAVARDADTEVWYCFEKICQLGIESSESKCRGTCQYHARCLQVKRPLLSQNENVVFRIIHRRVPEPR